MVSPHILKTEGTRADVSMDRGTEMDGVVIGTMHRKNNQFNFVPKIHKVLTSENAVKMSSHIPVISTSNPSELVANSLNIKEILLSD